MLQLLLPLAEGGKRGEGGSQGEDVRGWARFSHLPAAPPRPPILPPSSSPPPTHVALATASSLPPRGWGRYHAMLCRSPAGRYSSRRCWRASRGDARARGL